MKPRKLELVSLEDRSVPAVLTTYAAPLPPPTEPTVVVAKAAPTAVFVDSDIKVQNSSLTIGPLRSSLDKLAANHNQTLVRDRRRGKSRRG